MATRRGRDYWVLYDTDLGRVRYTVQRTFITGTQAQTPLTNLFFARLVTLPLPPGLVRLQWQPRRYTACFFNPDNLLQESNFSVISPYHPTDVTLKNHGIEIKNYDGVVALQYQGERWVSR